MITPERLVLARTRRGLTQIRLASMIDCSKSHIEKLERGATAGSPELVNSLAKALAVPPAFLSAPALPELPANRVNFRALTKMTAQERDSALAAGSLAMGFSGWIDERFQLPNRDLPDLGQFDAEAAAENLRAAWQLSDAPISNMVHLLEAHGVRVFSLAEQNRDVDAFSFLEKGRPFVFLNTMKSAERSRFDAAHELGHLVLHGQREHTQEGRQLEDEANSFASAFLMPRRGIFAKLPRAQTAAALIQAKREWGVSLVAFAYRLHHLGVLTSWYYKRLCIEFSRLGYRTNEPSPITRETSQVLKKVLHQLRSQGLGKAEIARELALSPEDLDDLVFGLVIAAVG